MFEELKGHDLLVAEIVTVDCLCNLYIQSLECETLEEMRSLLLQELVKSGQIYKIEEE